MNDVIGYFVDKINKKYPFTFIDVGAMGDIALKWNELLGAMRIIAFEPDVREFHKLKSTNNIKYFNYALHNKSEDLKYYLAKEAGKSSILKPNVEILSRYENVQRYQVIKEEDIPAKRVKNLDAIIKEKFILDADFIKLDTQGSELLILEGGKERLLQKVFGAQIEVEFIEMYKNQPLFRDIDKFMDSGFQLIDLRRQYWKRKDYYSYSGKGQLIFGDALYFKKINIFYQELSTIQDEFYTKTKIFKAILVCLVYRIFDYAVAVAKMGLKQGYLTDIECEDVILKIKRYSLKGIPSIFRLNNTLYSILSSILQRFRPRSYLGWSDSDIEIGNIKDK